MYGHDGCTGNDDVHYSHVRQMMMIIATLERGVKYDSACVY